MAAKDEVDAAVLSFFGLFAHNAPKAYLQGPPKRSNGWRSRVLNEACKLVTKEEYSAFSKLIALISKGPSGSKGLAAPQLPKDLDHIALEQARAKRKAIKPADGNLSAFGTLGKGFQAHLDSEEFLTSGDPHGWIGERVRRVDSRSGQAYDGTIVKWTPHGEAANGDREAWWRVLDDEDPQRPLDGRINDLDEIEVHMALKAHKGIACPSEPAAVSPPQQQFPPPQSQQSLLKLLWQRKGRAPPYVEPEPDGSNSKRQRRRPMVADEASLFFSVDDFPIGHSSAPIRRIDKADQEYVEWCMVVGYKGKDTLRLEVPNASATDSCTTSLQKVQQLVERQRTALVHEQPVVQPQTMTAQEGHAPRAAAADSGLIEALGTCTHSSGPSVVSRSSGGDPSSSSLLRCHKEVAVTSKEQSPSPAEQVAEQEHLKLAEDNIAIKTAESEAGRMVSEPEPKLQVKVEDSNLCVVCLDDIRSHLLVPCGHHCACMDCAKLLVQKGDPCPICRKQIESIVRVFQP